MNRVSRNRYCAEYTKERASICAMCRSVKKDKKVLQNLLTNESKYDIIYTERKRTPNQIKLKENKTMKTYNYLKNVKRATTAEIMAYTTANTWRELLEELAYLVDIKLVYFFDKKHENGIVERIWMVA